MQELLGAKQIKIKRKKKAKTVSTPGPTPAELPSFPFKLSCGDSPVVREWLKDNGCTWGSSSDLTNCGTKHKHLYVKDTLVFLGSDRENIYKGISLTIQQGVVVAWSCSPSDKTRLQEALDSLISANNQSTRSCYSCSADY